MRVERLKKSEICELQEEDKARNYPFEIKRKDVANQDT